MFVGLYKRSVAGRCAGNKKPYPGLQVHASRAWQINYLLRFSLWQAGCFTNQAAWIGIWLEVRVTRLSASR